jgi:hypothetical protein
MQMVMWVASALNSNIVDRESLASKNNIKFIVLIAGTLILFFFVKERLTLDLLIFIHFSIIFVACLLQYHSLLKKAIYFKRSFIVLLLTYLFTCGTYFLLF